MSVLPVGIGSAEEGGYQIERSLRFNSADSTYLNRTPASAGNRKTWTWSGWVKRSGFGLQVIFGVGNVNTGSTFGGIYFNTDNTLVFFSPPSGGYKVTTQVFRDPSAWYHIVCAYDTTNSSVKLYVNGSEITSFTDNTNPSANVDGNVNAAVSHAIGRNASTSEFYLNGYLTEINFIDGSALDPTSFGEFNSDTGVWQPKAYTGSYGTTGFYLPFSDNTSTTTLGYDAAGSNDWTLNNFSVTAGAGNDSLVDSPTRYGTDTGAGGEVRGNYATLNPLTGSATLSNGNLVYTSATGAYYATIGTVGVSSGKWYWEVTSNGAGQVVGICGITNRGQQGVYVGSTADSYGYYGLNGQKYNNGSSSAYGATYTTNDVIGVALDLDAGTIVFYKNNVSQGTAFSGLSGTFFPMASNDSTNAGAGTFNFGQRPFAYTAPSGFKALCTKNLPEPTIVDGGEYFNTVLYTGNGASSRTITGVGFQPDFVWTKSRSAAYFHNLYDAVRGFGSAKSLHSNSTDSEGTYDGLFGYVSAATSDGFSVADGTTSGQYVNENTTTYVAWNWKANGAGVSNTAGSISSTVSANTDAGFSIVTYTGNGSAGATVGHGLGVAPAMMIIKTRSTTNSWVVYHQSLGNTKAIYLNLTGAADTNSSFWNNTSPSSTVATLGTDTICNQNTTTYVAYCFAPVAGYSAFGSYTGNGSADGVFVYTGFRPRWILYKPSNRTATDWVLWDTTRNPYNICTQYLLANSSGAEGSVSVIDILSNGFKQRVSSTGNNGSGDEIIYAAFAENPFAYALAR